MNAEELFDAVEAHDELVGIGMWEDDDGELMFQVQYPKLDCMFLIKVSDVADKTWDSIEGELTMRTDGHDLSHYSRVCGYFSRVENWNPSKVGEREARVKGDYSL
jgi:hypothetical protein